MRRFLRYASKFLDNNLSLANKIRLVVLWFWLLRPIYMIKYCWGIHNDRREHGRVREFLRSQGVEIEKYQ